MIAVVLRKFAELPVAQMGRSTVVLLPCVGWRCLACVTSSWQFWTFPCVPALIVLPQLSNISYQFIQTSTTWQSFSLAEWLHWADKLIVHWYVTKACRRLWASLAAWSVLGVWKLFCTERVTSLAECSAVQHTAGLLPQKSRPGAFQSLCRKKRESWRSRLSSPAWRTTRQGWACVSSSPCLAFPSDPRETAAVAFPTRTWQDGKSSVLLAAFWPAHILALSSSRADLTASFANNSERVTFLDLPRFCCLRFWKH